ncbi:MAG: hypothetical protein ABSF35_00375 [Polyangia bacterium]|jgi:hypothetical protein
MSDKNKESHRWKFFRAGDVDQVVLAEGDDLEHLSGLDQKLWMALSCPTRGLEFDSRTLKCVDTDQDGHIRPPEILAAVDWAKQVFRSLDDLFADGSSVPLASIKEETQLGRDVLAASRRLLAKLGRPDASAVSAEDVAGAAEILAASRFNGDGIVPADCAQDEPTRRAIEDIIAAMGSKPDRSGKPGVDQPAIDQFFDEVAATVAWLDRADQDAAVRPLGKATLEAAEAVAAVRAKVDDYFTRCRLAAFDGRAVVALAPAESDLAALGSKSLTDDAAEIAKLPLAVVGPQRPLSLSDGLNPAWASKVATLVAAAVRPILGADKTALTESDWMAIKETLAPFLAWQAAVPSAALAGLTDARVRELHSGTFRQDLCALVVQDAALEDQSSQINLVEKMLLFRRDLVRLVRNFVNFSEFYGQRRAIFQAGTLYLDGRSCSLCLPVEDAGKHAAVAGLARAFLVYCDCTRKGGEKRSIVAVVTGGGTDNLMVGRNGVFYDRKGIDWDATVTRIIENPIGIRQAFWAPYKRFVRMIEEQVAKRASAADAEARQKAQSAAMQTAHADKTKAEEPTGKPSEPKKIDVGTVAAIGVAVAGMATFLSSVLATFLGLGMWMPVGALGLLLAISGPSMLIAWLKLRQRNVGPILDANGWSVNALAKINIPFGSALTKVAALPRGARRQLRDPFAQKRSPWGVYLTLLVLLGLAALWWLGHLDSYLPGKFRSESMFGREVPAKTEPVVR